MNITLFNYLNSKIGSGFIRTIFRLVALRLYQQTNLKLHFNKNEDCKLYLSIEGKGMLRGNH